MSSFLFNKHSISDSEIEPCLRSTFLIIGCLYYSPSFLSDGWMSRLVCCLRKRWRYTRRSEKKGNAVAHLYLLSFLFSKCYYSMLKNISDGIFHSSGVKNEFVRGTWKKTRFLHSFVLYEMYLNLLPLRKRKKARTAATAATAATTTTNLSHKKSYFECAFRRELSSQRISRDVNFNYFNDIFKLTSQTRKWKNTKNNNKKYPNKKEGTENGRQS